MVVLQKDYTDPGEGGAVVTVSDELNYYDDVYTAGDKVSACSMQKNGTYKIQSASVKKLINDQDGLLSTGVDIIPSFIYETNKKTLGYFPRVQWPEGKLTLESGCQ